MSIHMKLIPASIENGNLIEIYDEEDEKHTTTNPKNIMMADRADALTESTQPRINTKLLEEVEIKTAMKDKELILKAIANFTERLKIGEKSLDFTERGTLEISSTRNGTYDLIFNGHFHENEIESIKDHIMEEYNYLVQEENYKKIVENIRNSDYTIQSEDVSQDDSIVLTLQIN